MISQRTKFTSLFAPLELSETDIGTLEQLSRMILGNYVTHNEQHVCDDGSAGVDKRVWKPIKRRGNACVHITQEPLQRWWPIDSFANSGGLQPSGLLAILTVGAIPGTLNDVMYGSMGPTVEVTCIKTSNADAAALHMIAVPSQPDPFQSCVVMWAQNCLNLLRQSIRSHSDFVYLERTGFHLVQEVHFPQTHDLPSFERGNILTCGLFRDDPNKTRSRSLCAEL